MIVVYVAGPFSAKTRTGVEFNIRAAERVGIELVKHGFVPLIPHANTSAPEFETLQPYKWWLDATLELLRRCDHLVTVPGWEASGGACAEVEWCENNDKRVFHSVQECVAFHAGARLR